MSRRGADARDLAAQLRADRAAGAGDQHDLARRGRRRRGRAPCAPARGRGRPRPAPRGPGGRSGPPVCSSSKTVGSVRTGIAAVAAGAHHAGAERARRRRDRDRDLVGLGLVEDPRQRVGGAEHLHAVDAHAALERVVVDEADRAQAEAAGCAGSRAGRGARRRPAPTMSTPRASLRARNPRSGRSWIARAMKRTPPSRTSVSRKKPTMHAGRRRSTPTSPTPDALRHRLDERDVAGEQQRGDERRACADLHEVALADVAPLALVEAEEREDDEAAARRAARPSPPGGPGSARGRRLRDRRTAAGRRGSRRGRPAPRRPRAAASEWRCNGKAADFSRRRIRGIVGGRRRTSSCRQSSAARTAATTSPTCSSVSAAPIGSARWVRAASSVPGRTASRPSVGERRLAVRGDGVVRARADPPARAARPPAPRRAGGARRRGSRPGRRPSAGTGRRAWSPSPAAAYARAGGAAALAPRVHVRQLDAQRGGLQLVEAAVVADLREGLLVRRAVEAQRAHALGERGVAGRDRAAVAEARRGSSTGRRRTSRSCRARRCSAPRQPRAGRLRGVLEHGDAERLDLRDRGDVAEQVHEDHGLRARGEDGAHGLGRRDGTSRDRRRRRPGVAPVGGIASALA